jgi:hypothetical protein
VKNKKVKSKKNKDIKTLENGIAKIRTKNFRLKSLKLICIISVIEFLFVILQANSILPQTEATRIRKRKNYINAIF